MSRPIDVAEAGSPDAWHRATPVADRLTPQGSIAVLIPCFNEAAAIVSVVEGFRRALPSATVYVYDNNSTDGTGELAGAAGAIVRTEPQRGKGNVVRRMFADIDADCYLMVDGDDTYDASVAGEISDMVIRQGYDFVNVARSSTAVEAYRRGHRLGNRVLTEMVRSFFGRDTSDMLSGYKALSRRFVKSFPAMSGGFETETELTVHALEMRMPMAEIFAPYRERPAGSVSKLRTYQDGARILMPVVFTFFETGLVPRLPTAVLSVGLVLIAWLSIFTGVILDVVTKARQELKRLTYLSIERHSGR